MKFAQHHFVHLTLGAGLLLPAMGCSGDETLPVDGAQAGTGGTTTSIAGSSGAGGSTAGVGGTMAAAGAGAGGSASVAGAAGQTMGQGGAAGSAGADSVAGAAGSAGAPAVSPDTLVCNPGPEGNGFYDLGDEGIPEMADDYAVHDDVPKGMLTDQAVFQSTTYADKGNNNFPYRIYASANYVKGEPAVFMTFADGFEYIDSFKVPVLLDNLTNEGVVPPAVVLFIQPPEGEPLRHEIYYDPPTEDYGNFLLNEIIPAVIDTDFPVSQDPNAWATGGHSASGVVGWNVLWKTDRYRKFFGHNASFGAANVAMYNNVDFAQLITDEPKRDLRVSLVTAPVGQDLVEEARGDWTLINKGVADALEAKGNDYRFIIGPGDHGGGQNSRPDFPTAMRWMFRGCKFGG